MTAPTPPAATKVEPMHCANDCKVLKEPWPWKSDPDTGEYACGQRHWCPWCGDCEFCYGEGPHEWD